MTAPDAISDRGREVMDALRAVIDPELGIDIMSLGLVYRIEIGDDGDVAIQMTLTVRGCPMSASIRADVERAVSVLPWVDGVRVEVTFDPPWTVERLSPEARRQLGR